MPNQSGTRELSDELFQGIIDAHMKAVSQVFQRTRSVIDPGAILDEWQSEPAATATFTIGTDRPALIEHILYSYTPIGAATITIGQASGTNRNIPVPAAGTNNPGSIDCAMVVRPGDVVTLSAPGATSTFIEVMGHCLTGSEWSVV